MERTVGAKRLQIFYNRKAGLSLKLAAKETRIGSFELRARSLSNQPVSSPEQSPLTTFHIAKLQFLRYSPGPCLFIRR
jgi:hypothetical protein